MAIPTETQTKVIRTLDDIINRKDRYDVNKITFYSTTDDGTLVVPDKNLFEIYYKFVAPYVEELKVTLAERRYYKFKPYLLSLDIYDTPSLWWMLMYLNDRECPSQFYLKQTMRYIPPKLIGTVFDTIATRSAISIKKNWNEHLKHVGEDIV